MLLPPTEEGAQLARTLSSGCVRDVGGMGPESVPPFPIRPPPEVLEAVVSANGMWFDIAAEEARPLTLFIPAGWWHWVEGASAWHVAWGGSFYAPSGAWEPDA